MFLAHNLFGVSSCDPLGLGHIFAHAKLLIIKMPDTV